MSSVGSFALSHLILLAFQYNMEVLSKSSTGVERMDSRVRLPGLLSCLHFLSTLYGLSRRQSTNVQNEENNLYTPSGCYGVEYQMS